MKSVGGKRLICYDTSMEGWVAFSSTASGRSLGVGEIEGIIVDTDEDLAKSLRNGASGVLLIASRIDDELIARLRTLTANFPDVSTTVVIEREVGPEAVRAIASGACRIVSLQDTDPAELAHLLARRPSPDPREFRRQVSTLWKSPVDHGLTPRQSEVIDLLMRGFNYDETAASLGTSVNTVRSQVREIYRRLGVTTKPAAVYAASAGDDRPLAIHRLSTLLQSVDQTLTPHELDVLRCLQRGLKYKAVATELSISINTVRTHVKNIYRKLEVHSATAAVFEANRLGLLE